MLSRELLWIVFAAVVVAMLAIDLGVVNRRAHTIRLKEALVWSGVWITLGLLFSVVIYFALGPSKSLEYLTGFLIEKALSIDNIFVFVLIFTYFQVPSEQQHRVLFWGILSALIMRGIMIYLGVGLIENFEWVIYLFGAFLVFTGIRIGFRKEDVEIEPEKNPLLRLLRRFLSVTDEYKNGKFFIRQSGKFVATPLFVALVAVETTDLLFALDSIPAIIGVTRDRLIVFTSNAFAIMGLRALYFALASVVRRFQYLHYGLAFILAFVGVKMLVSGFFEISIGITLGVVVVVITAAIAASILTGQRKDKPEERQEAEAGQEADNG